MFEVGKMYRMKTGGFRMVYHEASNVADLLPGAIEDTPPEPVETLRDRFAMAALPAVIMAVTTGQHSVRIGSGPVDTIVLSALEIADAMMKAREQ